MSSKIIVVAVIASFLFFILIVIIFRIVLSPKNTKLAPPLKAKIEFSYDTPLQFKMAEHSDNKLMIRKIEDEWIWSGPLSNYEVREASSMGIAHMKIDGFLIDSNSPHPRVVIGRYSDRGAGMHGWHITMIKIGKSKIDFTKHQRFRVWLDKDTPTVILQDGTPKFPKDFGRHYLSGLADVIYENNYDGYTPTSEEDLK